MNSSAMANQAQRSEATWKIKTVRDRENEINPIGKDIKNLPEILIEIIIVSPSWMRCSAIVIVKRFLHRATWLLYQNQQHSPKLNIHTWESRILFLQNIWTENQLPLIYLQIYMLWNICPHLEWIGQDVITPSSNTINKIQYVYWPKKC